MSTTMTAAAVIAAVAPVTRRVRAYFAPVDRASGTPTFFDPAQFGRFPLNAVPQPWVDLGWITKFNRKSGTQVYAVSAGSPEITVGQVRTKVEAVVSLEFEIWGKIQLAIASGSQQTNLLASDLGASPSGSGGVATAVVPLIFGNGPASTSTSLNLGQTQTSAFSVGNIVAVDVDYAGQLGYVGAGVSAAYVQSASAVGDNVNYVRRVTLNVGIVTAISDGLLELASPLPAGTPTPGMGVCQVVGFCDREGGSFFQEWSALFVMEGEQGDRVIFHYPRLQAMQGSSEIEDPLSSPLSRVHLAGNYRALPTKDMNDGEMVLCFRSYLPAAMREV